MSMITLFSAFMGLYVIVRLILPSGMNWPLKLILSLFALACAEKLLLTKLVYGTMGAFMPEPVQLASGYLHSAVTILFLLLVARDALLLLTWPFRRSTGRQRKIFYGHKEKKPASGFWAFTLVLLALALSGYGMREALRVPPVREVRMQVPGLPDALNGFRIAQLSDLHIGPTFGKAWLTDVVARTDSLNPDLIVITGDVTQVDLTVPKSGLSTIERILDGIDDIAFAHLKPEDVVRHALVGKIVAAYDRHTAIAGDHSRSARAASSQPFDDKNKENA